MKILRYWTDLRQYKNGQSENGLPVVLLKICLTSPFSTGRLRAKTTEVFRTLCILQGLITSNFDIGTDRLETVLTLKFM